jgi:L-proline---[L-prolyl-carrier protein] ligase
VSERVLHDLLRTAAAARPQHVAVEMGDTALSYRELDERSNRVAGLLRDLGVGRGDRVGLFLDKSPDALVGIYGILKAGAAYVPFDPQAPTTRLAYIARNAGLEVVISGAAKAGSWGPLLGEAPGVSALVVLDAPAGELEAPHGDASLVGVDALDSQPGDPRDAGCVADDLAYILYTSGSTGEPKGVMLSHRNALAFVDWAAEEFSVGDGDRLSSHAPFHFDLSVFDLYAAAWAGATVVLVPPQLSVFPIELARFIAERVITVWYSVPSILSMLVMRGRLEAGSFPQLRTILYAGEVFPTKYLFTLMELLPHVAIANLYGPTETNVCTWYALPAREECPDDIPIGRAIAGVEAYAVDEEGRRVRPGEVGELYVTGPTVMQGYWGDAERTARSLIPAGADGWPTYRTGDLVLERPDGHFRFLGRRDAQIKSRGYRIELGDIEATLYAHPSVVECAAVAIPDELVTNRIKAFVVVRDGASEGALADFCRERLPRYMVPEIFDFRDELPKSSTGKIARAALETQKV